MEYEARSMEYGVWSMESGVWSMEYGVSVGRCENALDFGRKRSFSACFQADETAALNSQRKSGRKVEET